MKIQDDKKNHIHSFDLLIEIFSENIRDKLYKLSSEDKLQAQEIRIRINKPVEIVFQKSSIFINQNINRKDIDYIFKNICDGSVYSFQEQIKNSFITFRGGHRIGIASSVVIDDDKIYNIRDITSLNIRIAKEFKELSKTIYDEVKNDNKSVLIVGVPSSGKTTLLRNLSRSLSLESKLKVTIVDEKSEIAAVYNGEPYMDIGMCDVLTGFPKAIGVLRAIRFLSPDVIVCDEISGIDDAEAIKQSLNSGVKVIASIHSKDDKELIQNPQALSLLSSGAFEKIIFLKDSKSPGEISKIMKVSELINVENYRNYFSNSFRSFNRV